MSAKLRNSVNEDLADLEMDMSPMIDMVFLLLIFFIVASKIVTHHLDPEVKVPLGENAAIPPMRGARIIVNVYQDDGKAPFASEFGRGKPPKGISFNNETELSAYIGDRMRWLNEFEGAELKEIGIVIRAHHNADVGMVKRAVQAAADQGITTVTFSAFASKPSKY